MQIINRDISLQENLIQRFPAKIASMGLFIDN